MSGKLTTNIFLIGMPCSGKTYLGNLLAKKLGVDWLDADESLESIHKRTIIDMIRKDSMQYFRKAETEWLKKHCPSNAVISTGGGVIELERNRKLLRKGFVVYLNTSNETLKKRLKKREHLKDIEDWDKWFFDRYAKRRIHYEQTSDLQTIRDCNNKSDAKEMIEVLAEELQRQGYGALV